MPLISFRHVGVCGFEYCNIVSEDGVVLELCDYIVINKKAHIIFFPFGVGFVSNKTSFNKREK